MVEHSTRTVRCAHQGRAWPGLVLALLACSCRADPPMPDEVREQLGRVAVQPVESKTRGDFITYARGRIEGGAKGALFGLLYGVLEGLGPAGTVTGPFAGGAVLIGAGLFALVGGALGGVQGAQRAVPDQLADEVEATIDRAVEELQLGPELALAVVRAGLLRPEGAEHSLALFGDSAKATHDTRVEVRVPAVGFIGGSGDDPVVHLYVDAELRVVNALTETEAWRRQFRHSSIGRPFHVWVGDGAALLSAELERAQTVLAERIIDEIFVVTEFPFRSGLWAVPGTSEFGCCWFRPVYPAQRRRSFSEFMLHPKALDPRQDSLMVDEVDALQPTLRWEQFPRPRDLTRENEEVLRRISAVRYEVKVWEAPEGFPARLVCDRIDLRAPEHVPEVPLRPGLQHFWTFRARYRLDGRPQVTRWAFSSVPATSPGMPPGGSCDIAVIPNANYFRFATPSARPR